MQISLLENEKLRTEITVNNSNNKNNVSFGEQTPNNNFGELGDIYVQLDGIIWKKESEGWLVIQSQSELKPSDINILEGQVPIATEDDNWGGINTTDYSEDSTYIPLVTNGNIVLSEAIDETHGVNLGQVNTIIEYNIDNIMDSVEEMISNLDIPELNGESFDLQNTGTTTIEVDNSIILTSNNSTIKQATPNTGHDFIVASTTSGINRNPPLVIGTPTTRGYNSIMASTGVTINEGGHNFIGASFNSVILGESGGTADPHATLNVILASSGATIFGRRTTSAIIASTDAEIEHYPTEANPNQSKWNSAIVASHGSVIQSTNSYTLVTGKRTQSNASAQLVCGQSNIIEPSVSVEDPNGKRFIVGNGTGDVDSETYQGERSNAFWVNQSGKAWVQTELEVESSQGLILTSPNGTKFRVQVTDEGEITATEI